MIENVAGAPLRNPVRLYGSQFGLLTQRERWFEASFDLRGPVNGRRKMRTPSAGNGKGPDGSISICGSGGVRGMTAREIADYWSFALGGVGWMTRAEMAECIPPCYGAFVGMQAANYILARRCACEAVRRPAGFDAAYDRAHGRYLAAVGTAEGSGTTEDRGE